MNQSQRREHLIDTAIALFTANGFHATGIDRILAEAGVSKKTLYRHFRSKDELILAALKKYDGLFRNSFMRQAAAKNGGPKARLLGVFDVAGDWFESDSFFGCVFINAIGEYAAPETPLRQVCKDFKTQMRRFLAEQTTELPVADPEGLADELALLLEGAIVTAQVSERRRSAAETAKRAAAALIDQAVAAGTSSP
ncbi:MAG TPA: TetR/AcrR family transcriptional regulator [Kiloniellaceae bacterium]|nr:TetR/AcrR family transcriptional regulator [Kiloniellaceae bacterium]